MSPPRTSVRVGGVGRVGEVIGRHAPSLPPASGENIVETRSRSQRPGTRSTSGGVTSAASDDPLCSSFTPRPHGDLGGDARAEAGDDSPAAMAGTAVGEKPVKRIEYDRAGDVAALGERCSAVAERVQGYHQVAAEVVQDTRPTRVHDVEVEI